MQPCSATGEEAALGKGVRGPQLAVHERDLVVFDAIIPNMVLFCYWGLGGEVSNVVTSYTPVSGYDKFGGDVALSGHKPYDAKSASDRKGIVSHRGKRVWPVTSMRDKQPVASPVILRNHPVVGEEWAVGESFCYQQPVACQQASWHLTPERQTQWHMAVNLVMRQGCPSLLVQQQSNGTTIHSKKTYGSQF